MSLVLTEMYKSFVTETPVNIVHSLGSHSPFLLTKGLELARMFFNLILYLFIKNIKTRFIFMESFMTQIKLT